MKSIVYIIMIILLITSVYGYVSDGIPFPPPVNKDKEPPIKINDPPKGYNGTVKVVVDRTVNNEIKKQDEKFDIVNNIEDDSNMYKVIGILSLIIVLIFIIIFIINKRKTYKSNQNINIEYEELMKKMDEEK